MFLSISNPLILVPRFMPPHAGVPLYLSSFPRGSALFGSALSGYHMPPAGAQG